MPQAVTVHQRNYFYITFDCVLSNGDSPLKGEYVFGIWLMVEVGIGRINERTHERLIIVTRQMAA